MLTTWLLFVLATSALIALGARALESALLEFGGPSRWAWMGALALAPMVAIAAWLPQVPSLAGLLGAWAGPETGGAAGEVGVMALPGVGALYPTLAVAHGSPIAWLDPWLGLAWALGVCGLAGMLLVQFTRMSRARAGWPRVRLPEGEVLVSHDTGPAVLGVFRNEIVLPRWCLALPVEERTLIFTHEDEHRRSHDTVPVWLGAVVPFLLPWNLPAWWMWTRLRAAVEVDCDARVARRHPAWIRRYGDLLLQVGARAAPTPNPLTTFSRSPSTLSRRIDMLTRSRSPWFLPRSILLALVAVGLVVAACLVPGPDDSEGLTEPSAEAAQLDAGESSDLSATPQFTPHDQPPSVRNPEALRRSLSAAYPAELRDNGIGGTVMVHAFVEADGAIGGLEIAESSGHSGLDAAALEAASVIEFDPARNQGETVPVWIQLPVTFGGPEAEAAGPEEAEGAGEVTREAAVTPAAEGGPHFTPHDQPPTMSNVTEVRDRLVEVYPAELRDNGIGGTAMVHVFIDAEGTVHDVTMAESSGHAGLDQAALEVAGIIKFAPARNRGEAVPVWVQVPINFTAR